MYHFSFSWRLFLYPFLFCKSVSLWCVWVRCSLTSASLGLAELVETAFTSFPKFGTFHAVITSDVFSVPFFPPLLWDSNDTHVRYCLTGPRGSVHFPLQSYFPLCCLGWNSSKIHRPPCHCHSAIKLWMKTINTQSIIVFEPNGDLTQSPLPRVFWEAAPQKQSVQHRFVSSLNKEH